MDYQSTLAFLFSQFASYQRVGAQAYKANLDNAHRLDSYFGHPHKLFKTIHVAGTNGKGSVSHMLSSILMAAGYRVGLYTSPHLRDFRERIRVNGQMIAREEVVSFVEGSREILASLKPSFFEITVAMAFLHFALQQVDIAVVEVGLGGRLDSTNIITPVLSLITNISLDHTEMLGCSLHAIASEKAGIIKPHVPVVVSQRQSEVEHVFLSRAKELDSPISFADEDYRIVSKGMEHGHSQQFEAEGVHGRKRIALDLDLMGAYQWMNVLGVLCATNRLVELGLSISDESIQRGLSSVVESTGLLGRWQVVGTNPLTICDTAHNIDGIKHVVNQLNSTPHNQLHLIVGMVNDKDIEGMLSLLPREASYYFVKASIPRALDAQELSQRAFRYGLTGQTFTSIAIALEQAKKNAHPNDLIFIGGSTFVVAEVV